MAQPGGVAAVVGAARVARVATLKLQGCLKWPFFLFLSFLKYMSDFNQTSLKIKLIMSNFTILNHSLTDQIVSAGKFFKETHLRGLNP
jgi:hypothetical protein